MDNQKYPIHSQKGDRGHGALLGMAGGPVCCKVEYVEGGGGKILTDYDQGL